MGGTELIAVKLQKALHLYNKAKMEIFDNDTDLPNPGSWIYNKDELKNGWLKYVDKANGNIILKMCMLNNSFSHYMQYMRDNL